MSKAEVINTSNLAKLYRTTTGDIEKKLVAMGHKPVQTVIMQSGRRFMAWDKKKAIESLDGYKARRLQMLKDREEQRKELDEKQHTIPRTGYGSPDVNDPAFVPTDFAGLEELPEPSTNKEILEELKRLRDEVRQLRESAPKSE